MKLSHVIIRARVFKRLPRRLLDRWLKHTLEGIPKMIRNYKKVIKTESDFYRIVAIPLQEITAKMINPAFVTRSGLRKRDILARQREKLKDAPQKALESLSRLFQKDEGVKGRQYAERVIKQADKFKRYLLRSELPLIGAENINKGLTTLAAMWLTGDLAVLKYLKKPLDNKAGKAGRVFYGKPICIASPEKVGLFKKALINRLRSEGAMIISSRLEKEFINLANENINKLVEQYRDKEFAPFSQNGLSHINYIALKQRGAKGEFQFRLALDIRVCQI
jgi:isopropylmalate/homocitrate/citramalate synthase